jgi:hypothetical protein
MIDTKISQRALLLARRKLDDLDISAAQSLSQVVDTFDPPSRKKESARRRRAVIRGCFPAWHVRLPGLTNDDSTICVLCRSLKGYARPPTAMRL